MGKSVRSSGLAAQISELNLHKAFGYNRSTSASGCSFPPSAPSGYPFGPRLVDQSVSFQKPFSFKGSPPSVLLWTDACQTGLGGGGCYQSGSWVAGSWGPNLVGSHVSILDLHTVLLSLQSSFILVGFLVLVFSNNSATFQALLKQGLSRSLSVTSVVSSIS